MNSIGVRARESRLTLPEMIPCTFDGDSEESALAEIEVGPDRIDLRDCRHFCAGTDQVANLGVRYAGDAVNR